MPLNSIHSLTLSGEFCAVPISISLAYKQLADDPVGINTGVNLIRKWFDEPAAAGGAWRYIRPRLSNQLGFSCASDTYDQTSVTAFLGGAVGLNGNPATPSPLALQVEIQPQNPHPDAYPGRFFMPGLCNEHLERAGLNDTFTQAVIQFYKNLLEVEDLGGGQGPRYHLIPHAGYRDRNGSTNDVLAFEPFGNLMVKIVGSRRSDGCQAFLSGADTEGFETITVPPTEPTINVISPVNGGSQAQGDIIRWAAEITDWDATEVRLSPDGMWDSPITFLPLLVQVGDEWERAAQNANWLGVGTHQVYAVARNAAVETIVSDPIIYTVT